MTVTNLNLMWLGVAFICLCLLLKAAFYFYFDAKEKFVDRLVQKGKDNGKNE